LALLAGVETNCAGTDGGGEGRRRKYVACNIGREVTRSSFSGWASGTGLRFGPLGTSIRSGSVAWLSSTEVGPRYVVPAGETPPDVFVAGDGPGVLGAPEAPGAPVASRRKVRGVSELEPDSDGAVIGAPIVTGAEAGGDGIALPPADSGAPYKGAAPAEQEEQPLGAE
jgi:hypothetical protein